MCRPLFLIACIYIFNISLLSCKTYGCAWKEKTKFIPLNKNSTLSDTVSYNFKSALDASEFHLSYFIGVSGQYLTSFWYAIDLLLKCIKLLLHSCWPVWGENQFWHLKILCTVPKSFWGFNVIIFLAQHYNKGDTLLELDYPIVVYCIVWRIHGLL